PLPRPLPTPPTRLADRRRTDPTARTARHRSRRRVALPVERGCSAPHSRCDVRQSVPATPPSACLSVVAGGRGVGGDGGLLGPPRFGTGWHHTHQDHLLLSHHPRDPVAGTVRRARPRPPRLHPHGH